MAAKATIPFLVSMMLVTGVCNTLLTKYQDMQCVRDCDSSDPRQRRHFEQPVIQTAQMFVGEMGCWLVVAGHAMYVRYLAHRRRGGSGYRPIGLDEPTLAADEDDRDGRPAAADPMSPARKPLVANDDARRPLRGGRVMLLALPAGCDIAGTTLMNVGLLFVAASIYQMTRGALVLFVGLFSVLFLRRRLRLYQWSALVLVVLGVALVGLAGALFQDRRAVPSAGDVTDHSAARLRRRALAAAAAHAPETLRTVVGILLIAAAQIFTACQFVLEEWILEHYALEPLKVVGWEGIFGSLGTIAGMIVLHVTVGRTARGRYGYFDAREGWRELTQSQAIGVSSVLIMISIGGFNFFGLSVTRTVSATSRSTIDTCRTLFIWIVSLMLGWETFKWLQVLGFVLLVYGTFVFNDIVRPPLKACVPARTERLLPEEPIEHI